MNDIDGLMRMAEWSDAFFNYVPAECVTSEFYRGMGLDELFSADMNEMIAPLLEEAGVFKQVNPDCPYSSEWLVKDFLKRL